MFWQDVNNKIKVKNEVTRHCIGMSRLQTK